MFALARNLSDDERRFCASSIAHRMRHEIARDMETTAWHERGERIRVEPDAISTEILDALDAMGRGNQTVDAERVLRQYDRLERDWELMGYGWEAARHAAHTVLGIICPEALELLLAIEPSPTQEVRIVADA